LGLIASEQLLIAAKAECNYAIYECY